MLVVSAGDLYPNSSGFLKVPTKVYIRNMSYDEYTADFIFPDSSERYLTRSELVGLSKEELRLARNEIFARHGRLYKDVPLNAYFSSKSWYQGTAYEDDFDTSVFNDYEWKNLEFFTYLLLTLPDILASLPASFRGMGLLLLTIMLSSSLRSLMSHLPSENNFPWLKHLAEGILHPANSSMRL